MRLQLVSFFLIWASSAHLNSLPSCLLVPPKQLDPHRDRLDGITPIDSFEKPRAVLGYVSDKAWAFVEFLSMGHSSWRYITQMVPGGKSQTKLDLWVFAHPSQSQLSQVCIPVDLDAPYESYALSSSSQCFVIFYPPPPEEIWHSYPFINNVHFFSDNRLAMILIQNYGLIMKSDFDVFFTPSLMSVAPRSLLFGIQEYTVLQETSEQLKRVAADLHLEHKGHHNLGPTWLGDAATIISMANYTIPVLHHIITKEFDQLPGGGIAQKWGQGEGWPRWSAGIAAMYATEIVANHFIDNFESTQKMDMHGDSSLPVSQVIHIHCRHGDGQFNKFDFFKHHYDHIDLAKTDFRVVKDYAMALAVSTWRMLHKAEPKAGNVEL